MSERTASQQNLKQTQPHDQGRREANMANETTDGQGKNTPAMTLEEARARIAGQTGKKYWRSVDELADTPAFREAVQREFPSQAAEWIDPVSRRGFLKVMSASLALAGLAGCTKQPDELIYPYVKEPEDLVLGRPVYFATAFPFPTGAVPLLVKSDAYRPIKVDGNPDHPVNRGTSDPLSQGSVLDLYDPDRSQRVISRGEVRQFAAFLAVFRAMLADKKASGGAGLYILSDTVTSPTLAAQWKTAQQNYPNAKWLQWDPVNRDSAYSASKTAFGDYYDAQYRLEDADVIVSLDADFLSGITHPGFLRLAADYAGRRKLAQADADDLIDGYSFGFQPLVQPTQRRRCVGIVVTQALRELNGKRYRPWHLIEAFQDHGCRLRSVIVRAQYPVGEFIRQVARR